MANRHLPFAYAPTYRAVGPSPWRLLAIFLGALSVFAPLAWMLL